jgi:hypothetical protein
MWRRKGFRPVAMPIPRPSPMNEYVRDITAASVDNHQILLKLGICDSNTWAAPKIAMYKLFEIWQGDSNPF